MSRRARLPSAWLMLVGWPRIRAHAWRFFAFACVALCFTSRATAADAGANGPAGPLRDFAIPASDAEQALTLFARQAEVQLIYDAERVAGIRTRAVQGRLTPAAALERLLRGTSLHVVRDKHSGIFAIARRPPAAAARPTRPSPAPERRESPRPVVEDTTDIPTVEPLKLDELLVTGTARPTAKMENAFSISTLTEANLTRLAARSPADLVRTLPGFWAEPSGGEGGNNLATRGLPSSNFLYVGFFEDGLPNFQEQQLSFGNADVFLRMDATIESVEALRGGPASIFASNSPGANINVITKKGTATPGGLLRLTLADYGQLRWDGVYSGPLASNLTGSIGGFYRIDDGQRPAGFTANRGGQGRVSLTQTFAAGSLTAYLRKLDDRTVFYVPIPLRDPRNPARALAHLIDPHEGTLTSDDFRHVRLRTLNPGTAGGRTLAADLSDGIHTDLLSAGAIAEFAFGDGWRVRHHFRQIDNTTDFNGLFSTSAPEDAANFLAQQLARARAAWGSSVASARYVFAHQRATNGTPIAFNPSTTDDLVITGGWWRTETAFRNRLSDTRVTKLFETAHGSHEFTAGLYTSTYRYEHRRYHNTLLLELHSRPRALDIEVSDASGNRIGTVTENGFLQYGTSQAIGGLANEELWAPYFADTWQLGLHLRLDAGLRLHRESLDGFHRLRTTQDLGNPTTLADDAVGGDSGRSEVRRKRFATEAWTFGANYAFTRRLAVYGRYTSTFRTPDPAVIYLDATRAVTRIDEWETGLKFASPTFSVFASAFANRLSPVDEAVLEIDAAGVFRTVAYRAKTRTIGTELELAWKPLPWFELAGNTTLQSPIYTEFSAGQTGIRVPAAEGRQIRRMPRFMADLQPRVFFNFQGRRSEVFAEIYHAGRRFVDNANRTELPAYTTFAAGLILPLSERVTFQLTGANLTNSVGLTEGNPRLDQYDGQGTREAIYGRPIFGRSFQTSLTYRF